MYGHWILTTSWQKINRIQTKSWQKCTGTGSQLPADLPLQAYKWFICVYYLKIFVPLFSRLPTFYLYYNGSKSVFVFDRPVFSLRIMSVRSPIQQMTGKLWKEAKREAIQNLASPSCAGSHVRYERWIILTKYKYIYRSFLLVHEGKAAEGSIFASK